MDHLAEVVGEDSDGIEPVGCGQLGDEVDADEFPRCVGYGERLRGGLGVQVVFSFGADFASLDVLLDKCSGLGPPEGAVEEFVRPVFSRVPCGEVVMALLQYVPPEIQIIRHVESSPVVDQSIIL